jgi:CubicO group peptidase (beta-lactamase class C family)
MWFMKLRSTLRFGFLVAASTALFTSCQLGRLVWYNFADLNDHEKFPSRPLTASEAPFTFYTTDHGKFPKQLNNVPFDQYLKDQKTVAFLIIRRDTIQYEQYFNGYDQASMVPSFSMAKSVTSILIGCALDDGLIQSVDEPITRYIPELAANGFDQVTIKHLLQMTSGLKFNESYSNPFGEAGAFYYGVNLRKQIARLKLNNEPGQQFDYVSGNTQLLGLVLERALKDKTITAYLQEKLWTPLAMEYDASWSLDREEDGLEKTFCCLNARARDFAKIGRLYQHQGNWNGTPIVSQHWVAASTQLDTADGSAPYYQYQWWLPTPNEDFMAQGILGQFVYVHPGKDLVMVRLGHKEGDANWWRIFTTLAENY